MIKDPAAEMVPLLGVGWPAQLSASPELAAALRRWRPRAHATAAELFGQPPAPERLRSEGAGAGADVSGDSDAQGGEGGGDASRMGGRHGRRLVVGALAAGGVAARRCGGARRGGGGGGYGHGSGRGCGGWSPRFRSNWEPTSVCASSAPQAQVFPTRTKLPSCAISSLVCVPLQAAPTSAPRTRARAHKACAQP